MKKKVFFIFAIALILCAFFVNAAEDDVDIRATACLQSKVTDVSCDSLSTEEKIFTLLSIGQCRDELADDSDSDECWPDSGGCTIKTTAQAILAMKKAGSSIIEPRDWLLEHAIDFASLDWFLQVESSNTTTCTAKYSGGSHTFTINEDKTLSGNAGSCLSLYGDYWFRISSSCYDEEFTISCENSFLTSLLYKRTDSSTIYVSGKTNSAAGSGSTRETVSSMCFEDDGSCSYEGTLWAAIVLKSLNYNTTAYLPYLISMAEDNEEYIPEAFLYTLTGDYKNELLLKQQENSWWSVSGDKFYDTAIALLPFQNSDLAEKTASKNWLTEIQDEDGCWQGNVRNTALLLYSLWPKTTSVSYEDENDCEDLGYYCISSSTCTSLGGNIFSNYTGCFGTNVCCDKQEELQTCSAQGGELCSSSETCVDGTTVSSSDSNSAKTCCVGGTCEIEESECQIVGGYCKSSCASGEEESSYNCNTGVCCITKQSNYLWLIILLVLLIGLTALGIVFRKKLKDLFLKFKTKFKFNFFKKKKTATPQQKLPQTPSSRIYPGGVQRTILPNQQQRAPMRRPPQKQSEFDDILKKLKEIGK